MGGFIFRLADLLSDWLIQRGLDIREFLDDKKEQQKKHKEGGLL